MAEPPPLAALMDVIKRSLGLDEGLSVTAALQQANTTLGLPSEGTLPAQVCAHVQGVWRARARARARSCESCLAAHPLRRSGPMPWRGARERGSSGWRSLPKYLKVVYVYIRTCSKKQDRCLDGVQKARGCRGG